MCLVVSCSLGACSSCHFSFFFLFELVGCLFSVFVCSLGFLAVVIAGGPCWECFFLLGNVETVDEGH